MDNSIPKVWEREGIKNPCPEFGNGKGMKLIPKVREQESEAFIPGNDRERKFSFTTDPHLRGTKDQ